MKLEDNHKVSKQCLLRAHMKMGNKRSLANDRKLATYLSTHTIFLFKALSENSLACLVYCDTGHYQKSTNNTISAIKHVLYIRSVCYYDFLTLRSNTSTYFIVKIVYILFHITQVYIYLTYWKVYFPKTWNVMYSVIMQ